MKTKDVIRNEMIKTRNTISKDDIFINSYKILDHLLTIDEFKNSNCVSTYLSFGNEVDTFMIVEWLVKNNKKVVVPYTEKREIKLTPVYIKDIREELTVSAFGYPEPIIERVKKARFEEIDFVIVPGVGFDIMKNRIGYGKGYYDKYLSGFDPQIKFAGLAHDFQILDSIPTEPHDIGMDLVITEKRIIR
ncbi:MAG TPA: 5-formyltetrahydrofolate cyclo-ligase [Clostridiales bacterium]|nr:5-formyltetrahydrofolate cyclo-ligase [Clostridiales bacterium]